MAKTSKKEIKGIQNRLTDVSKISKLIDRSDTLIIDERDGKVLDKDTIIDHFLVIYDTQENMYYNELLKDEGKSEDNPKEKDYSGKTQEELEEELTQEMFAHSTLIDEDDEETSDSKTIYGNIDQVCDIISRELRLTLPSDTMKSHRGWFIVPIYAGMTEVRPVWARHLELNGKLGFELIPKDKPLFTFKESPFKWWAL